MGYSKLEKYSKSTSMRKLKVVAKYGEECLIHDLLVANEGNFELVQILSKRGINSVNHKILDILKTTRYHNKMDLTLSMLRTSTNCDIFRRILEEFNYTDSHIFVRVFSKNADIELIKEIIDNEDINLFNSQYAFFICAYERLNEEYRKKLVDNINGEVFTKLEVIDMLYKYSNDSYTQNLLRDILSLLISSNNENILKMAKKYITLLNLKSVYEICT